MASANAAHSTANATSCANCQHLKAKPPVQKTQQELDNDYYGTDYCGQDYYDQDYFDQDYSQDYFGQIKYSDDDDDDLVAGNGMGADFMAGVLNTATKLKQRLTGSKPSTVEPEAEADTSTIEQTAAAGPGEDDDVGTVEKVEESEKVAQKQDKTDAEVESEVADDTVKNPEKKTNSTAPRAGGVAAVDKESKGVSTAPSVIEKLVDVVESDDTTNLETTPKENEVNNDVVEAAFQVQDSMKSAASSFSKPVHTIPGRISRKVPIRHPPMFVDPTRESRMGGALPGYMMHPDLYHEDDAYDDRYDKRYDTPYDTPYDDRYDKRYDTPYDDRYDKRYDTPEKYHDTGGGALYTPYTRQPHRTLYPHATSLQNYSSVAHPTQYHRPAGYTNHYDPRMHNPLNPHLYASPHTFDAGMYAPF